MTGNVDDFSDKKQTGNAAGFHRFCEKLAGIDAARSDLGFLEALGVDRRNGPGMYLRFKLVKRLIGQRGRRVKIKPAIAEPMGQ